MNPILKEAPIAYVQALGQVGAELRRRLGQTPAVVRPLTRHLAKAPGKHIRAGLLLACALGPGGSLPEDAVPAALAVELLHMATLVHDDIIDDAALRRGIATLHTRFGQKAAVLAGDYLLCMALQLGAQVHPREQQRDAIDRSMADVLAGVCRGELHQNQNNRNYALTERAYFAIIRDKTAGLFEFSCYGGFLLCGEAAARKDGYRAFGRAVGLAFQLADDANDYESTRQASKKPVLSDYENGVVTLPLIYALGVDPALRGRIEAGLPAAELKAAVETAGGVAYTRSKARTQYRKAMHALDALAPDPAKTALLAALAARAAGTGAAP